MEDDGIIRNGKSRYEFIDELTIKEGKTEYKIQFLLTNIYLIIQIISNNNTDMFCYQGKYTRDYFINESKVLSIYSNEQLLHFIKQNIKEIEKYKDDLIIKFNVNNPDGKIQIIKLNLKKSISDYNSFFKYLFDEIKANKNNIKKLQENFEQERKKHENEKKIFESERKKFESDRKKYESEINKNKKEILMLKGEIKKLGHYFYNFKSIQDKSFNSNISSFQPIKFILDYIKQNDKTFNFKKIKTIFNSSKDGDSTKDCHKLCDNRKNILLLIQTEKNYFFGGYTKIGFKTKDNNNNWEYLKDNDSFLFSVNCKKIYPVIKDREVICHVGDGIGLCFKGSLAFYDNFFKNNGEIKKDITDYFKGFENPYEMNGGEKEFKCKEIDVIQLF